jgi:hypothetical protein
MIGAGAVPLVPAAYAGRRTMSARRIKPPKVRGCQARGSPRGRSGRTDRRPSQARRYARAHAQVRHDRPSHARCRDFQAAFVLAQLDPLRALPILRVPGTGREPELNERQLDARRRVHSALEALGGVSSPAGSCVWHVVGLQRSVREWAIRQGWGGRPVRQEQAQGILVAALGMLVAHFGHADAKRAS